MIIRRSTVEDAGAIATIHVSAWQVAYRGVVPAQFLDALSVAERETRWRERLRDGAPAVWVATDDDVVRGWICVGKSRDADADATTAELWAIYVDPRHWRQGFGRGLWTEAAQHLAASGFRNVTLWVLQQNRDAVRFYAAAGFDIDPSYEKTVDLGGAKLSAVRLRHALTQ